MTHRCAAGLISTSSNETLGLRLVGCALDVSAGLAPTVPCRLAAKCCSRVPSSSGDARAGGASPPLAGKTCHSRRRHFKTQASPFRRPNSQGAGRAASLLAGIPKGPATRPPLVLGSSRGWKKSLEAATGRERPVRRSHQLSSAGFDFPQPAERVPPPATSGAGSGAEPRREGSPSSLGEKRRARGEPSPRSKA